MHNQTIAIDVDAVGMMLYELISAKRSVVDMMIGSSPPTFLGSILIPIKSKLAFSYPLLIQNPLRTDCFEQVLL